MQKKGYEIIKKIMIISSSTVYKFKRNEALAGRQVQIQSPKLKDFTASFY